MMYEQLGILGWIFGAIAVGLVILWFGISRSCYNDEVKQWAHGECQNCGGRMARARLRGTNKKERFYICNGVGCTNSYKLLYYDPHK